MEQGGSSTVQALLLQEAQQEISSLRTDLYAQRRVAEERRQALQAVTLERDTFKEQVHSLTAQLSELQSQLHQLRGLEVQYADLQRSSSKQQQELELSLKARRILEQELAGERRQRESLSEAKAGLEAERSRLQKARDDLTASLRVAQKKAADAEEEQMRAEEEAAALRAELQALQAAHGSPSMSASGYGAGSMPFGADGSVPAAEARHLQEQIEYERSRASALLTSLHEAKAQVLALQQQQQLDAQQHGYEEDAHLQRQVAQLSSSLAQANAQVTRLQSELQHQRELSEHLHSQLQQQQQQWQQQQQQQEGASAVQGVTNGHASHHSNHRQQFEGVNGVAQQGHTTSAIHPRHQHTHSAAPSDAMSTEQASEELDRLHAQVSKLRSSRDKLLEQIDRQWEEMERLGSENRALSEELERVKGACDAWEAQAQDALAHVDRLKDMLEEAAGWEGARLAAANNSGAEGGNAKQQEVEAALLAERARSSELELQLRALAAELLRSQQASMAMGRAVLPVLSGIEHRLVNMGHSAKQAQWELLGQRDRQTNTLQLQAA